jgi:hypothetical protein
LCSAVSGSRAPVLGERRAAAIERQAVDLALGVVERGIHPRHLLLGQRIDTATGLDLGQALVIADAVAVERVAQVVISQCQIGAGGLGLGSGFTVVMVSPRG